MRVFVFSDDIATYLCAFTIIGNQACFNKRVPISLLHPHVKFQR